MHYSAQKCRFLSSPVGATKIAKLCVGLALIILSGGLWAAPESDSAPLLIRNVSPVDAKHGLMPPQDVLISAGHITAMGQDLVAPPGVRIVDGQDRFLTPGLWDMHVHLSYDSRFIDIMPDLFLDYGITSVRDTGGDLKRLKPILASLYGPDRAAPRVFFAGPLLDGSPVVYGADDESGIGQSHLTTAQARSKVETLAKAGVDFIKIYEMVSPEVFEAFTTAASAHNLPIAAHVPLAMLASDVGPKVQSMEHLRNVELDCAHNADSLLRERRALLKAGQDQAGMSLRSSIHHAQRDSAIQNEDPARCERVLTSLSNTIQVPTARLNAMTQYPPFGQSDWGIALDALPEAVRSEWIKAPSYMDPTRYKITGEWTLDMIPRLAAHNISIGAGTDTPIGWAIPGYSLHRELEVLVAAGLDTQRALAAATLVPASFFGLQDSLGQVSAGYEADLLLLDANPLEDIRHSRQIRLVISRGKVVRSQ
ncbi:amidohydrolase family protein [Congregibacter variabilis]|uniref:Amidohydrolase family protein n=1 Tax=Congregibacter variabilis TaxID=3081200 RepID=A0ABZ0I7Y0_9GAMM|nr:amidohydrolase family protein [Congregibacter sp. IMCC43200]